MKSRKNDSESGFTLIEVIITLVVVAVVAAMMTAYFGTSITQSSLPISWLNKTASLNEILEKISAQYGQYPHWRPDTPYAAGPGNKILPTKRTGLLYTPSTGGTSGATTEPTDWLKVSVPGGPISVPDNTVTWTSSDAAPTLAPLVNQAWQSGKIYSANSIVVNGSNQYIVYNIVGEGRSGGSTPIWSSAATIGSTVTPIDGTVTNGVTWRWSSNTVPTTANILQTLIGAEGSDITQTLPNDTVNISYHVVQNRFIKFNTSNTEDDNCTPSSCDMLISGKNTHVYGRYLKVTISLPSNPTGESLTTLFVLR